MTLPVVAPSGTVALTWVALTGVKVADTPLNLTDVTPPKFVPMIATDVPTGPWFGDRLLILGPTTVKVPALVDVPGGVVTEILPVVAPVGTVVLILVALATVNVAPVPLNRTALTLVNPVPLIVTAVPTLPLVGEKLVMVSPPVVTVKSMELVAVPAGCRDGDPARGGPDRNGGLDVAGSDDGERGGRRAVESHGGRAREVPAVDVDGGADRARCGRKPLMKGAAVDVTLKLPLVDAVPPGVVTEIGPSVAPLGTLTMICVRSR